MKCKICKSEKLSEIVDLGLQPLANKYPKNIQEKIKEKKYPLKIMFCNSCKSAQIKKIIDRNLLFTNYYYLSSINNIVTFGSRIILNGDNGLVAGNPSFSHPKFWKNPFLELRENIKSVASICGAM